MAGRYRRAVSLSAQADRRIRTPWPRLQQASAPGWVRRSLGRRRAVLWAEGEVSQAAVFGENLVLTRRVEAKVGDDHFTLHDESRELGLESDAAHDALPHQHRLPGRRRGRGAAGSDAQRDPARRVSPAKAIDTFDAPEPAHVERVMEHDVIPESGDTVPGWDRQPGAGYRRLRSIRRKPAAFPFRLANAGRRPRTSSGSSRAPIARRVGWTPGSGAS